MNDTPTINCPQCAEQISASARLCRHCKSRLDWKRWFSIGNTSLALLAALVAILSVSVPTIIKLLERKDSVISAYSVGGQLDYNLDRIHFMVRNDGPRPGIISGGQISIALKDFPTASNSITAFLMPAEEKPILVPPKSAMKVEMIVATPAYPDSGLDHTSMQKALETKSSIECSATLETLNAGGLMDFTDPAPSGDCPDVIPRIKIAYEKWLSQFSTEGANKSLQRTPQSGAAEL